MAASSLMGPWAAFAPEDDLEAHYRGAGAQYGVSPALLRSMVQVESQGNRYAVSNQDAEGIAQILPSTAAELGVSDTFSPRQSIYGMAKYLRQNMDQFRDPNMAIAAYHGGPDTARWGPRTVNYVDQVGAEYQRQKGAQASSTADATAPPQQSAGPFVIGDSIAQGIQHATGAQGGGTVGASMRDVLATIGRTPDARISGRDVVLSSGASNAPNQIGLLDQQIAALKQKGASSVTVVGVGTRPDLAPLNERIQATAAARGARFVPLGATPGGVHPADYSALGRAVLSPPQPTQVAATPPPWQVYGGAPQTKPPWETYRGAATPSAPPAQTGQKTTAQIMADLDASTDRGPSKGEALRTLPAAQADQPGWRAAAGQGVLDGPPATDPSIPRPRAPVDPNAAPPIEELPSAAWRAAKRVGQAAEEGWEGAGSLLTPEQEASLNSNWNPLNRYMVVPAAKIAGGVLGAAGAVFRGGQQAVVETGRALGNEQLGRDIAAMPEAFMGSPHEMAMPEAPAAGRTEPRVPEAAPPAPAPAAPSRTPMLDRAAADARTRMEAADVPRETPAAPTPAEQTLRERMQSSSDLLKETAAAKARADQGAPAAAVEQPAAPAPAEAPAAATPGPPAAVQRPAAPAEPDTARVFPEPQSDIDAQMRAVVDPSSGKDTLFVALGSPEPTAIPEGVYQADRPDFGRLYTSNPEKLREFQRMPAPDDTAMARLLGYPETKEQAIASRNPVVVQATDSQGNVVHESVATPASIEPSLDAAQRAVPAGGSVDVTSPEAAIERRAAAPQIAQPEIQPMPAAAAQANQAPPPTAPAVAPAQFRNLQADQTAYRPPAISRETPLASPQVAESALRPEQSATPDLPTAVTQGDAAITAPPPEMPRSALRPPEAEEEAAQHPAQTAPVPSQSLAPAPAQLRGAATERTVPAAPETIAPAQFRVPEPPLASSLYSFPGALLDPEAWRRALGPLAPAAGRISDLAARAAKETAALISPMQAGTRRAQAVGASLANTLRRIGYEYGQIDKELEREFKPTERARMGSALDRQSVFEQQVRAMPPDLQAAARAQFDASGEGLGGLSPLQRAKAEQLNAISQDVWQRMRQRGMVEAQEGIPYYMPRQMIMMAQEGTERPTGGTGGVGRALDQIGSNLQTRGPMAREHLTPEETEAAARAVLGENARLVTDIRSLPNALYSMERSIAGRDLMSKIEEVGRDVGVDTVRRGEAPPGEGVSDYFTLPGHPAFRQWTGTGWQAIRVAKEFEGPLKAVLSGPSNGFYRGYMTAKSGVMHSIMISPFIHLGVEIGRSFPAHPSGYLPALAERGAGALGLPLPGTGRTLTFRLFRDGAVLRRDIDYMKHAIDNGLSPLGAHGRFGDLASIADQQFDLGGSRNAFVRALANYRDATARGVENVAGQFAGDILRHPHQTLLWDQVFNLQVGLYDAMRNEYLRRGRPDDVASSEAAYLANRYAGALPPEHLSRGMNIIANVALFSRSFTLGNAGIMKDAVTGAASHVLARISEMIGPEATYSPTGTGLGRVPVFMKDIWNGTSVQAELRRKALATVALDIGLAYVSYNLAQAGLQTLRQWLNGGNNEDGLLAAAREVFNDWYDKAQSAVRQSADNPLSIFGVLPTHWNEPGKQDRVYAGNDANGRGIYLNLPPGKVGMEFIHWWTQPGTMLVNKLNPMLRPIIEFIFGRDTLGRELLPPDTRAIGDYFKAAGIVVDHIAQSLGPAPLISGLADVYRRQVEGRPSTADPGVTAAKIIGPLTGLAQVSSGFPGGPAAGEIAMQARREKFTLQQRLPAIREKILGGDIDGAISEMRTLNVQPGLMRYYIRSTLHPGISGGGLRSLQGMPDDVKERVQRDLERTNAPTP